jgi:hypothetical protein
MSTNEQDAPNPAYAEAVRDAAFVDRQLAINNPPAPPSADAELASILAKADPGEHAFIRQLHARARK